MESPLITHLDQAHLQAPPAQQVSDLLNLNQYVLTHTALVENVLAPLTDLVVAAPIGIDPLLLHLEQAHLQESPGQQVKDLVNVNQYVTTHTVLVEDMVAPTLQSVQGTYGC
jgi:hypothetical protein